MFKLKRNLPFHPLLLAAAPVTMLYVHNRSEVPASSLLVPLALCVAFVGLAWLAFGFLLRSSGKGAVLASIMAVLFLSFGHVTAATVWYFSEWGQMELARPQFDWAVLGFIILVLLTLGAWLWRTKRALLGLNHFLNVTSAVLMLICAFDIVLGVKGSSGAPRSAWVAVTGDSGDQGTEAITVPHIVDRPDVYLILADAHARGDVLRDVYGHDGEPFLSELEKRGFEVARNSWANYSVTVLAAPSMLNYDYVRDLDGKTQTTRKQMHDRVRDAQLLRRLKAHGYTIVGFEAGYEFTKLTGADVIYRPGGVHGNEFYYALLKTTPLPLVFGDISLLSEGALKRLDTLFLLETAPHVADNPLPTFAWIHLTIPHAPFVFGADGENVERRYRATEDFGANNRTARQQADYREAYRGQVAFTDKMILRLIDEILQRSEEPPIILVLSDHGPRLNTIRSDNWRQSDLREAMANLTACYFPGAEPDALYDSITPVNVVRVMLNEYFAADLPLIEDRIYHSPYGTPPFWLFEDVTNDLRARGEASEPAESE